MAAFYVWFRKWKDTPCLWHSKLSDWEMASILKVLNSLVWKGQNWTYGLKRWSVINDLEKKRSEVGSTCEFIKDIRNPNPKKSMRTTALQLKVVQPCVRCVGNEDISYKILFLPTWTGWEFSWLGDSQYETSIFFFILIQIFSEFRKKERKKEREREREREREDWREAKERQKEAKESS